ncbi:MAG: hypothetical protein FJ356_02775 [Thaumarchaeota archaeon]|nr:hypothetical protein [Nitrososphaerota archaeon]
MSDFPIFKELSSFEDKDDLYITAMGFEDRSLGSTKDLLDNNYKTNKAIVIRYNNYVKENERHRKDLEKIWDKITNDYSFVEFDTAARSRFVDNFIANNPSKPLKSVTINISSLITFPLIWMINFLFDNAEKVRIVYTEPEGYGNQLEDSHSFSSGVKEIFTMEEFSGAQLPGYLSLLVIFLGYDFIRARGIYDQIQPSKKIGIFAKPNTPKLYDLFPRMESEHKKSFESSDEVKTFSIFDLEGLIKGLTQIRETSIETSNILLALNGTKLHHIGALLFAKKYKDIQLLLSSPLEYYPHSYSFGKRRTFEINFELGWITNFLKT